MKKITFIALLHTFMIAGVIAGKVPMKWGKVSNDEMQMTYYSNDPQAPAVILCDYGTVEVGPRTEYYRHVRIKILNNAGLKYTTIEIPYKSFDRFDVLSNIKAQTYNLSANGSIVTTKLKSKDLKTEEIDSRNKKIVFTLPDVKPGSVIEYQYTIRSLDLVRLNNWYFQSTIPTMLSEYVISVPRRFNYLITFQKGRALEEFEQQSFAERIQWLYDTKIKKVHRELLATKSLLYASPKGTAKVYLSNGESMYFKMKDVPAIKPTPDMFAFADFYPTVKAHLYYVDKSFPIPFYYRTIMEAARTDYGSWNSSRLFFSSHSGYIIYWLPTWQEFNGMWLKDERIGGRFIKAFNYKPVLDYAMDKDGNDAKTVESIFKFIKSNIQWNGMYSMYASNDLNKVLEKKTGTSGEINILLIALLKRAGIEANPVLVRTRNLGRIENMYPASEQFNHIVAQVSLNGTIVYVDATASSDSFSNLPRNVENSTGWVLIKDNYNWATIMNSKNETKAVPANLEL